MDAVDEDLRRERRAKMAELQKKLDPTVGDTDRTSAPSVRQVRWSSKIALNTVVGANVKKSKKLAICLMTRRIRLFFFTR